MMIDGVIGSAIDGVIIFAVVVIVMVLLIMAYLAYYAKRHIQMDTLQAKKQVPKQAPCHESLQPKHSNNELGVSMNNSQ